MREGEPAFTLRAPLLMREPGDVVADGCVVVRGGRVVYAGRWARRHALGEVEDFPEALITPGFINAHTHLHLSFLRGRILPCRSFSSWLTQVAARLLPARSAEHRRALWEGVRRSLAAGVTTVGDIVARWDLAPEHTRTPLGKVVFLEVMGLGAGRVSEAVERAADVLEGLPPADGLLKAGLAPHAPYSVHPAGLRRAVRAARRRGWRLSVHVAETPAEAELLLRGEGELAARLWAFRLLPRRWRPPGVSPVELVARCGLLAAGALLVHCNFLSAEDVKLLARSGSPVAYCPRSAHRLGVREHPWRELRRRGLVVALGTDSLASNTSLSILDEMRFLSRRHPDLAPEELLTMGLSAGARALGLEGEVGSLRPGYRADLAVWRLPSVRAREAAEALIHCRARLLAAFVAGRRVAPAAR